MSPLLGASAGFEMLGTLATHILREKSVSALRQACTINLLLSGYEFAPMMD